MPHPGRTLVSIGLAALFVACGSPVAPAGNDAGNDAGLSGNNNNDAGNGNDAGSNDTDGGTCDLTPWVGMFSGPASATTTVTSPISETEPVTYTGAITITALANCQIQVDSGESTVTNAGTVNWSEHTLIFNVSGGTATLADAQPFAGTETYDSESVTFSGQATAGTITLEGTTATVNWSGSISGTTENVPWSGTYATTGTLTKQ